MQIGEFIRKKRKQAGLTQKDLAEKISISDSSVSRIEKGETFPSVRVLSNLSSLFHVSIFELIKIAGGVENVPDEIITDQFPVTALELELLNSYSWLDSEDKEKVLSYIGFLQSDIKYQK